MRRVLFARKQFAIFIFLYTSVIAFRNVLDGSKSKTNQPSPHSNLNVIECNGRGVKITSSGQTGHYSGKNILYREKESYQLEEAAGQEDHFQRPFILIKRSPNGFSQVFSSSRPREGVLLGIRNLGFNSFNRLKQFIRHTLLPIGFPHTVPPEYLQYQRFNILQDCCSYLRGIMSTQALLEGMGVGRSDVTALQATVQWVIRDGASLIGSLAFTSLSSSMFGQHVKSWRLFADFINNVGITLDMIAPLFRPLFLPLVCISSICKACCGVAAGASNAAIAEHWGNRHGNFGDVQAKNGAQHTLISLFGLLVSISFARFANKTPQRIWLIYSILTAIHMVSNYALLKILAFRSLNLTRFQLLLHSFFTHESVASYLNTISDTESLSPDEYKTLNNLSFNQISVETSGTMSIKSIASREPVISPILPAWLLDLTSHVNNLFNTPSPTSSERILSGIVLWASLNEIGGLCNPEDIASSIESYQDKPYIIFKSSRKSNLFLLAFKENEEDGDVIKGIYEVVALKFIHENGFHNRSVSTCTTSSSQLSEGNQVMSSRLSDLFDPFKRLLMIHDWDLARLQLRPAWARNISVK